MTSAGAMGIIFPNIHDANLPELVAHRTMASVPFAGRYRMVDFCLSGMTNAGMRNVGIVVRQNYQSLMDHLGSGREWDLSRKRGGLILFPPYARDGGKTYSGRIEGLHSVMDYLLAAREKLVVLSDCDIACNLNFSDLLAAHRQTGADVTMVYEQSHLDEGMGRDNVTLTLDEKGAVSGMRINDYRKGVQNLSMNIYVISRELLISIVRDSIVRGITLFEKDYLARNLKVLKVMGYEYTGYRARIYDMRSYFAESLRLIDPQSLAQLFLPENPIYTKVRDEAPVRYGIGSKVQCSILADGCIVEGEVENCVLFRGVRVGKGARLKNCVIMQGSQIGAGAVLENVVTDKNVQVGDGQNLRGAKSFPVFIAKGSRVI